MPTLKISQLPLRWDMKASWLPSGETAGLVSLGSWVICCGKLPSRLLTIKPVIFQAALIDEFVACHPIGRLSLDGGAVTTQHLMIGVNGSIEGWRFASLAGVEEETLSVGREFGSGRFAVCVESPFVRAVHAALDQASAVGFPGTVGDTVSVTVDRRLTGLCHHCLWITAIGFD